MATSIDTMEDLISVLDANPEWAAALRSRLLSKELVELPEQFAQLSATVAQLAEKSVQQSDRLDRLYEIVIQLAARMDQLTERLDRLTERVDQLTVRVDQLTERVDQLTVRLDQLTERVDQLTVRLDQLTERVDQLTVRLDRLTERVDQLTVRLEQLTETVAQLVVAVAELQEGQRRIEARQDKFEATQQEMLRTQQGFQQSLDEFKQTQDELVRGQQRLEIIVGDLKGAFARRAAEDEADEIADAMGMRFIRVLERAELRKLTEAPAGRALPANDRRSFRRADLIIEAEADDGQRGYIAVEVSYTADARDTNRAIRNAGYLTRFTGQTAYAAVAASLRDHRVDHIFDQGHAFWYELESDTLQVD